MCPKEGCDLRFLQNNHTGQTVYQEKYSEQQQYVQSKKEIENRAAT